MRENLKNKSGNAMKKYLFTVAAVLAIAGCAKEMPNSENEVSSNGTVTVRFAAPATKMTIGDKAGSVYQALWEAADVLDVVDAATSTVLGQATLESGAGANMASFLFTTTPENADGKSVKLVYPSGATALSVKTAQQQAAAGSPSISSYTYAESETVVTSSTSTVAFTLSHQPAFVRVSVGSSASEIAGLPLKRVQLFSKGGTLSDTADYVQTTIDTPAAVSATAQDVWICAKPGSFEEIYVVVTMGNDSKTVTIPVKYTGKTLAAGNVASISLPSLTLASNSVAWYEPVETRYIEDGWFAYGPTNTFFSSNASATTNYSVKARGEFRLCSQPSYVIIKHACTLNNGNFNHVYINNDRCTASTEIGSKKFNAKSDFSFDVKLANAGSYEGYAGKIGLYDVSDNLIWGYNLWSCKAAPSEITLPSSGITILDCNLGGVNYDKTVKAARGGAYYFQWGRPFGIGWGTATYVKEETKCYDLAYSASHALSFLYVNKTTPGQYDWNLTLEDSAQRNNYWGNAASTSSPSQQVGTKTIFDPCPAGWMVACPKAIDEIISWTSTQVGNTSDGYWACYTSGSINVYFPFAGAKYNNGDQPSNTTTTCLDLWTNAGYNANQYGRGYCYEWKPNAFPTAGKASGRSGGFTVRCMKDVENR